MQISPQDTEPDDALVGQRVSQIWRTVLERPDIDENTDFFNVGGSSIQWVNLLSELFDVFGVSLSLREAFTEPTAAGIARLVRNKLSTRERAPHEEAPQALAPCSASQQRSLEMKARGTSLSLVVLLRLRGPLDRDTLRAALMHTVRLHSALRTRFHTGPPPAQEPVEASTLELPVVDLAGTLDPLEAAVDAAWSKRKVPFDLDAGLLLRPELFFLGEREHLLSLLVDHIASDGMSIQIMLESLRTAYVALVRDEPLDTTRPRQFADFARWEQKWVGGEGQAHLEYWLSRMAGLAPTTVDRAERFRGLPPYDCFSHHFTCGSTTVMALGALSNRFRLTPLMGVLSAFSFAVAESLSIADVVVDTLMSNRVRPEAEGVVGFCANSVALRIRVDRAARIEAFIEQVRAVCWGGFAHQELPFSVLSGVLAEQLNIPHSRITEFYLNFSPADTGEVHWTDGLSLKRLRPRLSGSQRMGMRIGLFLWEEEGKLEGTLVYDRKTLSEVEAQPFVARFEAILAQFGQDPTLLLSEVSD